MDLHLLVYVHVHVTACTQCTCEHALHGNLILSTCLCVTGSDCVSMQAKAQLEETYRLMLDEKDEKINVMQTQVIISLQ